MQDFPTSGLRFIPSFHSPWPAAAAVIPSGIPHPAGTGVAGSAEAFPCHQHCTEQLHRMLFIRGTFPAYLKSFKSYMHVLPCISLPKMPLMGLLLQHGAAIALPCFWGFMYSHDVNNEESIVKVEWKKHMNCTSSRVGRNGKGHRWGMDQINYGASRPHLPSKSKWKVFARQRDQFNQLSLSIYTYVYMYTS